MELWGWGANNYGQLGVGSVFEQTEIPLKVDLPPDLCKIKCVSCGGGHTLLLNDTGDLLFAAGWNHKGQLGLGCSDVLVPSFVRVPLDFVEDRGLKIVEVCCGWDFSFVVASDGSVFACGSNAYGQLGLCSSNVKIARSFVRIAALKSGVRHVAAGMRHTVFLDVNGRAFSCGSGKRGQLVLRGVEISNVPQEIHNLSRPILSVHAGQHFTMFLVSGDTEECCSMIHAFGEGKFGETYGPGSFEDGSRSSFCVRCVDCDAGVNRLSCGWTHVVALMNCGHLVSWGRDNYNQLGTFGRRASLCDTSDDILKIRQLKFMQISVGYEHNLAVSEDASSLYAWGWNEHGNCGVGGTENVPLPVVVPLERGKKVTDCFAGSGHSFCLIES